MYGGIRVASIAALVAVASFSLYADTAPSQSVEIERPARG
jgi:hypothetical protein